MGAQGGRIIIRAETADEELVRATLRGDGQAFELLMSRHWRMIFAICQRLVDDADTAEDVALETFVKALERLGTFDVGRQTFKPWLCRIAANASCDEMRRRARGQRSAHLAPPEELERVGGPNWEEVFGNRIEREETRAAVRKCLKRLDKGKRDLIALRYWGEMTWPEMAARLAMPQGTVRSRTKAAEEALARCVKAALGDES